MSVKHAEAADCRMQVGGHLTSERWKPRDGENIPGKANIQHSDSGVDCRRDRVLDGGCDRMRG